MNQSLLFLRLKSSPTADSALDQWSFEAARSLFSSLAAMLREDSKVSLAFELTLRNGRISFMVAIPRDWEETVKHHLYTCYPGITIERVQQWKTFVHAGKYAGTSIQFTPDSKPLKSEYQLESDVPDACLGILSSLQSNEGACIQLLLRTNQQKKSFFSDVVKDVRTLTRSFFIRDDTTSKSEENSSRLESVSYEAAISVIAQADSTKRAEAIVQQVATVFHRTCIPGEAKVKQSKPAELTPWIKRVLSRDMKKLPLFYLTIDELSNIYHLPIQPRQYPRLETEITTLLPPPQTVANHGLFLGVSLYRGQQQPIYLSAEDRLRHVYLIGQTGTGKSTLFQALMLQDMMRGDGCCFIDPHGEAIEWLLPRIPAHRVRDVVLFDPGSPQGTLGLNLLEWQTREERDLLIQELIFLFYKLFDPDRTGIIGPQFEHWLRNAALTVTEPQIRGTLIDIPRLFTDPDFLDWALERIEHPAVQDFWHNQMGQTADFHKSEMLNYFTSKFGSFMGNTTMRTILSTRSSAFHFRSLMDKKKILLVNLSKGKLGSLNAEMLGTMIMTKLQMAALSRAGLPPIDRHPFYVYIDEFQNIATDSFATLLSEIRKYGLSLHLAHQYVDQLPVSLRQAVIGNVGTIAAFRVGQVDADWLSPHFTPLLMGDLTNIQPYHFHIRALVKGTLSSPFTIRSLPLKSTVHEPTAEAIRRRVAHYITVIGNLQKVSNVPHDALRGENGGGIHE